MKVIIYWLVSTQVNRPVKDDPSLIEPITPAAP
ncbi:hypothetical protein Q427_22285 [Halomonas sp. BC04]|nr:hypothetical protein Q427_22285 [Halomonas sp. BC04]